MLDSFSLAGRTALVTGGNRGLGRAFALALAQAGADVAVVARDEALTAEVVAGVEGLGRRAAGIRGDVTVAADVERAVTEAVDALGRFAEVGSTRAYLQVLDLSDLDHVELIASEVLPQVA